MTADRLDDLVIPEKKVEWETTIKNIWFADESPRGQKSPGYLKEEFTSTNGKFIGLRCRLIKFFFSLLFKIYIYYKPIARAKCYYLNHGVNIKRSHKGTPKHVGLSCEDYEAALFQNKIRKAKFNRIVTDNRVGSTTTKSIEKKAINPIYLKMFVADDLISVSPHSDKNGFAYFFSFYALKQFLE